MLKRPHWMVIGFWLPLAFWLPSPTLLAAPTTFDLDRIINVVVLFLENHSFDNLYGLYPGADGIMNAPPKTLRQLDLEGKPYRKLPRVINSSKSPPEVDTRFPLDLPNGPFAINRFVEPKDKIPDLTHRFYQHQAQMNGGQMNRFVAHTNAGGLTMGYYEDSELPLRAYAKRYTLLDHFFAAAFGGSFLNHMWMACACAPWEAHPPASNIIQLAADGSVTRDGAFTSDGFAVNNIFPAYGPGNLKAKGPDRMLAPQRQPTLGDRLSDRGIDWAWFAAGWDDARRGAADPTFQFHHQPYTYFERYREGTQDRQRHLLDGKDFEAAVVSGRLPPVAFYKPLGRYNSHPGEATLLDGERHAAALLKKLEKSPQWPGMLVIVTYDETGGFWDHVAPPPGDRFGPGGRVPTLLVSPFTIGGQIDHTVYDASAILRLIERRFHLQPLTQRDAAAEDLSSALRTKAAARH